MPPTLTLSLPWEAPRHSPGWKEVIGVPEPFALMPPSFLHADLPFLRPQLPT